LDMTPTMAMVRRNALRLLRPTGYGLRFGGISDSEKKDEAVR
jgi:hypothetical protein